MATMRGPKRRELAERMAVLLSHCITSIQHFGIINMISIDWGEPVKRLLASLRLMIFDLDLLHVACVATVSPVQKYLIQVAIILACAAQLSATHAVVYVV